MTKWLFAVALGLSACASQPSGPSVVWLTERMSDPVTDSTRCVVSAPDQMLGSSYTRFGSLYPIVEKNSESGLLVGVSSGGKYPVSPGDIVWRVDQNEPRTLTVSETPPMGAAPQSMEYPNLTKEQQAALQSSIKQVNALTQGMTSSIQNGVTLVGGEKAEALLDEMLAGSVLRFRPITAQAGLRKNNGNFSEIALDSSFQAALNECGIYSGK